MTRLETLYSMPMKQLVVEAEKIGVKVNKKGKNSVAAEKIYAEEQRRGLELYKEEPTEQVVEKQEAPVVVTEKKERKSRKKSFEELVADIPAPGNVRFIRAANNDVIVKRGSRRIFRYNGHCMIATSEKMFAGCDYEKQNWNGYVIHDPNPEIMKQVFKNA